MAGKSLSQITDDNRIAMPATEYDRIKRAKNYYADSLEKVNYLNSYGEKKSRPLSSVNVTKLAARRLASIIFNEQCSVNVSGIDGNSKQTEAQQLIDDVFEREDFFTTFEQHLEEWIALGSGAIRPYVKNDEIHLAWVNADQFYPLNVNTNEVKEAAIASKTTHVENDEQVYYTLLEFHQKVNTNQGKGYQITYELYRSTDSTIVGEQVPLGRLDEYADLQPISYVVGDDVKYPLFAFFKTPGANNIDMESPLGLGISDNALNIVDNINMTNDQFQWEVRMGRRRIAVPKSMLMRPKTRNNKVPDYTHPPMFDTDETVYQAMYDSAGNSQMKITDLTTPIRNVQYQATMDYFLHEYENMVGLSQGTFTATPSGVQTATEVVSNNSMTYQTRSSYLTMVEKTISGLVTAILELAQCQDLFSDGKARWNGDVDEVQTNVDFNDGVFVDQNAQMEADLKALAAGAMPKKQFLMRNYNLDEDKAEQWLAELDDEQPEAPLNPFQTPSEDDGNPDEGDKDKSPDDDSSDE